MRFGRAPRLFSDAGIQPSRLSLWIGALILLLGLLACKTAPIAGECPENAALRCMTEKRCSMNERSGCMQCRCANSWNTDRIDEEERIRGRGPE